jgi:hypothetical protein
VSTVHGEAGLLDSTTEDGRRLTSTGAEVTGEVLPLMALTEPGIDGHDGAVLVGRVRFRIDGNVLLADGEVTEEQTVPAGRYACGLDADRVEWEDVNEADEAHPEGRTVHVATRWRPMALTLYLNGAREPSFPNASVEVVRAP